MTAVYLCDGIRTPIGRYGGALATIRTDDLAAHPIKSLRERHPAVAWAQLDDVIFGCANQAGEDNRNVVRKGEQQLIANDEHLRPDTQLEKLAQLPGVVSCDVTVTAGNASGLNDGAAVLERV